MMPSWKQKQLYGMSKWSNSLCLKFKKQCQEMEQAIRGWEISVENGEV